MSTEAVQILLAAHVAAGFLTAEEARGIFAAWESGAITDADLPQPPAEAAALFALFVAALSGEAVRRISAAIATRAGDRLPAQQAATLVRAAALRPVTTGGGGGGEPPAVLLSDLATPGGRRPLADDLLDTMRAEVRRRTALLYAAADESAADRRSRGDLRRWGVGLRQAAVEDVATMARLGAGRALTTAEAQAVAAAAEANGRYVDGLSARIAAGRAGVAAPVSEAQVRSWFIRTAAGRAQGAYWQAASLAQDADTVAYFEGYDVGGLPCTPCLNAERGGPYLPAEAPLPGVVCLGGGHCHHYLRFEQDPATAARLRGTARQAA